MDFLKAKTLLEDSFLITIVKNDEIILQCQQRYAKFQRGTLNGEPAHRLALYRFNPCRFRQSPKHAFVLTKDNFYGMVNGSENRRVIYSSCYCPTISIVTNNRSVVITFVKYNEDKRRQKFDAWRSTIQNELHFGGYWSVQEAKIDQHDISPDGAVVLLCATNTKLALLTRNRTGTTYVAKVMKDMDKMVRSERTDLKNGEVQMRIMFSVDNLASHLSFKIKNDQGITRDLFTILDNIKRPVLHRTGSHRMIPQGTNVYDYETVKRDYRLALSRRISRDDLDLYPPPPPRRHLGKKRINEVQLQAYDLNAISSADSVQNALHFYENMQFYRERNPPDVVINRPSRLETEEYWSIVNTLSAVLRKKTPKPDTLNLPCKLRRKLCFSLLDNTLPSWKNLAEYIGLTQEAVQMTETLFQSGMDLHPRDVDDVLTPPECILRHWQFAHNQYALGLQENRPTYACSRESLVKILTYMERYDLAQLLQNHQQQQQQEQRQQVIPGPPPGLAGQVSCQRSPIRAATNQDEMADRVSLF